MANPYLSGLSKYNTSDTKINLFGASLAFTTVFSEIKLNRTHRTSGRTKKNNNHHHHHHHEDSVSFSGSGAFTAVIKSEIKILISKVFLINHFPLDVCVESKVTFKWFPTMRVVKNSRKVSIGSTVANFAGMSPNGAAVNQVISNGAPAWVNQNQNYITTQIQGILDQYITGILNRQPNILTFITALASYDPLAGC